ncbi:MAG TPA: hypothetical protein VNK95_09280, partial [Caldilineaceae bacterium]|nr:hypothetical protein [Caldilineaceae bacterium]
MPNLSEPFQALLERWGLDQMPSWARIVESMDPVAWTLVGLLIGAVVLGIFFSVSTRRAFLTPDDVEATPVVL